MALLPKNTTINYIYSILLFITSFSFGFYSNIILATLVDLRFVYSASLNEISYITIPAGIGYLIGSWANYMYKWVNRQLALVVFLTINAIVVGLLPHYGSLWIAFAAILINGIGGGAYQSAVGLWQIEIWPQYPLTILTGIGFTYGIGEVLAPLLAAPYVHGEKNMTEGVALTVEQRIRDLTVPFAVGSAMLVGVQLIFFILFFTNRYQRPADRVGGASSSTSKEPSSSNPTTHIPNRISKIILCSLCMAFASSAEIGYMSFSTAMLQYLPIALTASQAAYVLSILSTTSTVGRLLTTFISIKIKPEIVVMYHFGLIVAGLSVLFFGRNSLTAIYIGSAVVGYGFSATGPAMTAFTETYLRLTDRVVSFYTFSGAFISLITPLVLGQLFRSYPMVLFLIEFIFFGISIAAFVLLRIWIAISTTATGSKGKLKSELA